MSNADLPVQDELTVLKQRADQIGLSYHPSIGLETLRAKLNAALTPQQDTAEKQAEANEALQRQLALEDATRLVRIRVVCMNPAKKEWEGEIFTVGNSVVGTHKKFVPFNNDEGWHVPNMILQMMQERECQTFYTVRDERGNQVRKSKLIKEFAIEILPPLTPDELKDLAQRQAMASGV